jgi:hypothetical protein
LSDGSLSAGSRVSVVSGNPIGEYVVDFDRDVSNCAYGVTPINTAVLFDAEPATNDPDGVLVETWDPASQMGVVAEFYLTVTC